ASASFLAAAASLREGHVHCVDTWHNEAMSVEPLEDTFARFQANTHRFRHFLTSHRGRADQQAVDVPDGLDLLFLDGDHASEAVASDLTPYAPKVKPGGLVVLHDYNFASVSQATDVYFAGRSVLDRGLVHALKVFQLQDTAA